jgi:O-acetyl-ADP-ribose deacetylase (regulator of RNase III)
MPYFSKYTSESRGIQSGILPCKAVIHVVGPRNGEGKENEKLTQAINSLLKLAQQNNFKSISIPGISTGIFGFTR